MKNILIILLAILGIGALYGGMVFIISPSGDLFKMPLSFLRGSPFNTYLIPGIILFFVLGVLPILVLIALLKRPSLELAEIFNLYKDMYWAWTYSVYIAFALIIWIQIEMTVLKTVHWSHTLYMFFAIAILCVALSTSVRNSYRK